MKHTFKFKEKVYSFCPDTYSIEREGKTIFVPQMRQKWTKDYKIVDYGNKFWWFNVTDNCNLDCSYCYTIKNDKISGTMSKEKGMEILDYLASLKSKNTRISFFGGEPLLYKERFKFFVSYARQAFKGQKLVMSFATNGTLIDEDYCKFFLANDMYVQVSIDGTPEQHDTNRVTAEGKPSSHLVEKGIACMHKVGIKNFSTSSVYSGAGLELVKSLLYLVSLGSKRITFSPADASPYSFEPFNENGYKRLVEEYEGFRKLYPGLENRGIRLYPIVDLIGDIEFGRVKQTQCSAGFGCHSIDNKGDLNPCHRFKSVISNGNIKDGIVDMGEDFKKLKRLRACSSCWIRGLCGGPCPSEKMVCEHHPETIKMKCRINRLEAETALKILIGKLEVKDA